MLRITLKKGGPHDFEVGQRSSRNFGRPQSSFFRAFLLVTRDFSVVFLKYWKPKDLAAFIPLLLCYYL